MYDFIFAAGTHGENKVRKLNFSFITVSSISCRDRVDESHSVGQLVFIVCFSSHCCDIQLWRVHI